jgi:hypothetical protein
MRFKLMLMTCRIGDFEKPTGAVEQDDEDDDEGSPYAGAILIEPQAQAVRASVSVSTDDPQPRTIHLERARSESGRPLVAPMPP